MPTQGKKPKVLLHLPAGRALPGFEERHVERLRLDVPEAEWELCADEGHFLGELPYCRGVVVWEFKAEWLEAARGLAFVATPAAGREWIEVESRAGLTVAFGRFHGELIAETVLGLILAFSRGVKDCIDRRYRGEAWPRREVAAGMRAVRGSHALIVGFGHIGKWIGRLLKTFDMRITGVNRNDMERPDYFDKGDRVIRPDDMDWILPETDHLILSLPGGPSTDRVIDSHRLAMLSPDACVYNVGRGNAIDLDALVKALTKGALRGAGLDVFPHEPLPEDAAIRQCPNTVVMPHVSAFGPTYLDLYLRELVPLARGLLFPEATG